MEVKINRIMMNEKKEKNALAGSFDKSKIWTP
jgi:hypothetical protein